ncbi:MAG: phosphoglycerate kinase, partial [Myxococcota bacterium]
MQWSDIPSIDTMELKGKRVLMRLDLNAPVKDGVVQDDTRLRAALPTINYALARSARLILCSHLGRPKGKIKPEFSLEPVAKRLSELLEHDIALTDYPVGDSASKLVHDLRNNDILMLENLRFDTREKANDSEFSQQLAQYAEIYILDAFGTSHRAHASTAGIMTHMQGPCGIGFLMRKEVNALSELLTSPQPGDGPFVAILGGAKVSDKIGLIENLLDRCQSILIGGAMAYTFLKAKDQSIGASRYEEQYLPLAKNLIKRA